jgi:hypothetical protein
MLKPLGMLWFLEIMEAKSKLITDLTNNILNLCKKVRNGVEIYFQGVKVTICSGYLLSADQFIEWFVKIILDVRCPCLSSNTADSRRRFTLAVGISVFCL